MSLPARCPLTHALRAAVRATPEHAGAYVRSAAGEVDVTAPSPASAVWAFEQLRPLLPVGIAPGPVRRVGVLGAEESKPLFRIEAVRPYQLGLFERRAG